MGRLEKGLSSDRCTNRIDGRECEKELSYLLVGGYIVEWVCSCGYNYTPTFKFKTNVEEELA